MRLPCLIPLRCTQFRYIGNRILSFCTSCWLSRRDKKQKLVVYNCINHPLTSQSEDLSPQAIALATDKQTQLWIKYRKKVVQANDFSGIGLFVPYDIKTDVGYRDIGYTLKSLCEILECIDKESRSRNGNTISSRTVSTDSHTNNLEKKPSNGKAKLERLINLASIANDEGDFGTSLLLGRNLFCLERLETGRKSFYVSAASRLMATAYRSMGMNNFAQVAEQHAKYRLALVKEFSKGNPNWEAVI